MEQSAYMYVCVFARVYVCICVRARAPIHAHTVMYMCEIPYVRIILYLIHTQNIFVAERLYRSINQMYTYLPLVCSPMSKQIISADPCFDTFHESLRFLSTIASELFVLLRISCAVWRPFAYLRHTDGFVH